jgi:subtilisin family serine protease
VRRSIAVVIAAVLAIPLTMQIASPAASIDLHKLSPAMRRLVQDKGYRSPNVIAKAVRGMHRGDIYYLAQVHGRLDKGLLAGLQRAGARVRVAFPEINQVALVSKIGAIARVSGLDRVARLEVDAVQRLHGASVQYVSAAQAKKWGDQSKRGTSDVGADKLWAAGVDGSGVTVGVADSGVDSTHPDLDNLDWLNWGGSHEPKVGFADCQTSLALGDLITVAGNTIGLNPPDICSEVPGYDDNGHGTHVSGIATGTAQGRGQEGLYPGMSPGSLLRVAKVCTAAGTCLNSNVMAGMRYLAMEKSEGGAGADIINMSLGGSRFYGAPLFGAELSTNDDAEAQLVNALSQKYNVLFTISAGNSGPVLGSVSNPAIASQSLAVGAGVADFDLDHPVEQTLHGEYGNIQPLAKKNHAIGIAGFSSRGPSGDRLIKPDVVAPGVYIVAPEALLGGEVKAGDFGHQHNFSYDPTYAVLSGTSMSAPSAAGVAALVASGYKKAFGSIPAYYRLKAALANTAGTKAFEGSVAGLIFGTLVHNGIGTLADHYPVRNGGEVGITGTGAGRVNAPAALLALMKGVIAYTPQRGKLDEIHELQPSWAMDDIAPGGSARTSFLFRGAPQMLGPAKVTFTMQAEREPAGMYAAPASWFTLPAAFNAKRNADVPAGFGLRVPSNAKPGAYTATMLATVDLGSVKQSIRIPVQFFVRMLEPNANVGGSSIEGPIWASEATDYTLVGVENPVGDIYTDWTMIPLYVPKGVTRVDFTVYDVKGEDDMDVFIFDSSGVEIDSSVISDPFNWIPGAQLYPSSSKDLPETATILDSDFEREQVPLPATVWIAVSDTNPVNGPKMSRYHLDVDMIGAASTGINGVTAPAPAPAPKPRPGSQPSHMPATGVGSSQAAAVAFLGLAAAAAGWLRSRRLRAR